MIWRRLPNRTHLLGLDRLALSLKLWSHSFLEPAARPTDSTAPDTRVPVAIIRKQAHTGPLATGLEMNHPAVSCRPYEAPDQNAAGWRTHWRWRRALAGENVVSTSIARTGSRE